MSYLSVAFGPWLSWAIALVPLLGLASIIGLSIHRLYFSPYSKYPGPFLAKLTSWYSVYHTIIGDLHTDIWECHQKYGPIVRYAPNRILIDTEPGLNAIYGHGANVQKAKSYTRLTMVKGAQSTISTIDNDRHGKIRRVLNQGLSDGHIRAMDAEMTAVAALFAERLGEATDRFDGTRSAPASDGWSCAKNMAEWCDFFTFDIMSQLVFGTSYNLLGDAANHWIIDGVLGQLRRISYITQLPEAETLRLDKMLFPNARRKAVRFSLKGREIMEARKNKDVSNSKNDVFSKLLAAKDPETGEALSHSQLWAEGNVLIIAGSDTSSTGLAATFFYLTRTPSAYARVTNEVRSAFPTPDEVCQGPKLSSCVFIRACIQEALRLAPAVSGAMWREVLPGGLKIKMEEHDVKEEDVLDIPAGYEVGIGVWSLNHNERYYPEPFSFRPERWISQESGEEPVRLAKAAYATFSIGPRNCVGKGLAMTEMALAMAAVISRYDFRRADGADGQIGEGKGSFEGQYQTFYTFTSLKDGPMIQFRPYHKSNE
ncbi:cytochrome P450 [Aspergillus mulundensis]|uniref:Putative benzoate 4-monooxygenase cytochrome p450 n=1 Tax=Aspergillus mulundensis TaxID=1810919 RepID=A0A3D8RQI7_9EURO|nr:putative benzoate 4-monooxygenase cytochrome p450 [Aspergillus mulundensis]RDW76333.1 putative benzoate 4-monooxygenase cytochrome p450 [Aspergillus mulundensis]